MTRVLCRFVIMVWLILWPGPHRTSLPTDPPALRRGRPEFHAEATSWTRGEPLGIEGAPAHCEFLGYVVQALSDGDAGDPTPSYLPRYVPIASGGASCRVYRRLFAFIGCCLD
jgi:hypothetical protein